jgi:predicted MFS family arabinose efflux permease
MLRKLAARARDSDIDYRLLVPVLANSILVQTVVSIIRVTTSYRALELNLPIIWLGVISTTFAIFPIFLALWVGRFIDRGHDAVTAWIGATLLVAAAGGFALWSSPEGLLACTLVLGVAHLFVMSSEQMLCVRCAGARSMERVFANYMVAGAIGQGLGPAIVGWAGGSATLPPTRFLFTIAAAGALLLLAIALTIRPSRNRAHHAEGGAVVPIGSLLRVPGLAAVIVAGVFIVTAQDLTLIYLPLLGPERGIDVKDIGVLLTVRAAASMVSRILYPRLVVGFGREPLMVASTLAGACAFAALAAPIPLIPMYLALALMGFSLGIATTLSITSVVDRTPERARGTANSLRIMGNRLGQISLPFAVSLVAAATGVAGIMVIIAVSLAASATAVHWSRPRE